MLPSTHPRPGEANLNSPTAPDPVLAESEFHQSARQQALENGCWMMGSRNKHRTQQEEDVPLAASSLFYTFWDLWSGGSPAVEGHGTLLPLSILEGVIPMI